MSIVRYQDDYFYYFRKPHNIPSTYGDQKSLVERLEHNTRPQIQQIMEQQKQLFSQTDERGLVNRLDNETAGLLYFAKNAEIYKQYKQQQNKGKITKIYIAHVHGDVVRDQQKIAYDIKHHPTQKERMQISSNITQDNNRITYVRKLHYDNEQNYTCLELKIHKGTRHQIRCHLAAIGCPIIGEKIYKKRKDKTYLHLRSIGLEISD